MYKLLLLALVLLGAAPVAYCQSQGLDLYKDSPAYKKIKARNDSIREAVNAELSKPTSLDVYKPQKDEGLVKLDAKYGFRDVKFEMLPTQIKGLVALSKKPIHNVMIYTRPTDSKKIGAYSVYEITYTFFKGKLSSVTLKTDGFTNSKGVLEAFASLYGEPAHSNPYLEDYAWLGDKVSVMYSKEVGSDDATISLWSKKMQAFEEEENEKTAKKAASDL